MAKGFNKVTLLGNLTRDPETRTTNSGQNVTSFGLAINRTWRNAAGEQQEDVDYIDCVAWGKSGDIIAQYVQKGRALLVSGRLSQSTWEQDGKKRSKVEVTVEDFNFISDGNRGGDSNSGGSSYSSSSSNSSSSSDSKTKKKPTKKQVEEELVVEDIDDKPVDLSDIPF